MIAAILKLMPIWKSLYSKNDYILVCEFWGVSDEML